MNLNLFAPRHLSSAPRRIVATAALCAVMLSNTAALAAYCFASTPGQGGSTTTLSGVVNTYYVPSAASVTADPTVTAIGIGSVAGASTAIAPGDMALIIQMQCADINSADTDAYGNGVADAAVSLRTSGDPLVADKMLNNVTGDASGMLGAVSDPCKAGQYEYVRAGPGTTASNLDLTGNTNGAGGTLFNTYVQKVATTTAGKRTFQVIRVPQYSNVTLGGSLSALAWNGASGGVIALDVAGQLTMNSSTISARGLGFRAGTTVQRTNDGGFGTNSNPARPAGGFSLLASNGYTFRAPATANLYAGKAEGIAGTPLGSATADGYPSGDWGRGAPGNAGGGGAALRECCRDNGGGGGGGNGGPGGIGGTGWANNGRPYATLADANTGPTKLKTAFVWTDTDLFGYGGANFAASSSLIVMGGGGGSGDCNDCTTASVVNASAGANGGGIVMVRAGKITGSGTVDVRGSDAPGQPGNDAAGGGGAGGSIIVLAATTSTPVLTLTTKGGRGGDSYIGGTGPHGPGGGGGGGVVFQGNIGSPIIDVSGGASGLTNPSTNTPVQQIYYGNNTTTGNTAPADIAARQTFGSSGGKGFTGTTSITVDTDNPRAAFGAICLPSLTVTKVTTTPQPLNTPSSTQTPAYRITVTNAANVGAASGVQAADTLPTPFTYAGPTTYTPSGTSVTRPVASDPAANATALTWSSFIIPGGQSVTLDFPINRFQAVGTFQNSASVSFLDPTDSSGTRLVSPGGTYTGGGTVAGSNYASASSAAEDIIIESDLQVTKQALKTGTTTPLTTRTNGQQFDYLITVTNLKAVNATGVTVTDTNFPAAATPGTATIVASPTTPATGATFDPATKTLTVGALAAGQSVSVRIPVTVSLNPLVAAVTPNTAALNASTPADNGSNGSVTANNTQTVTTYLNPVQLRKYVRNVTASEATDPNRTTTVAKPLDKLEYCVQASSVHPAAVSVNVSDTLQPNQTFVAGSITNTTSASGGSYSPNTVSGVLQGISASQSGTLCFQTTVN